MARSLARVCSRTKVTRMTSRDSPRYAPRIPLKGRKPGQAGRFSKKANPGGHVRGMVAQSRRVLGFMIHRFANLRQLNENKQTLQSDFDDECKPGMFGCGRSWHEILQHRALSLMWERPLRTNGT
ncbi:hypothetical protein ACLOJK_021077 [Asimina triloba]